MPETALQDELVCEIAVTRQWIAREKLERALVVQRCISNRTRVRMPLGTVLYKMGLLTKGQMDDIAAAQAGGIQQGQVPDEMGSPHKGPAQANSEGIQLDVSADRMTATLAPLKQGQPAPSLDKIKQMLVENGICYGLVSDKMLRTYLARSPLPMEPFTVAQGTSPAPGKPPVIRYTFDTDPLRIGTLLENGSMDWKNRGEIPQVAAGAVLAEKVGGDPGRPGINVLGQQVAPPRIKDAPFKLGKGAERSEDGLRILAKFGGAPRLGPDGRVSVFSVLPIESDIGIVTGNVEFDGQIEVSGGIASGYTVKGKSLHTREIQNAVIQISEDVICLEGVYASEINVGGHFKASHIHNSTMEILGDLVVEKEIFGCTILVNGRCLIGGGKIIGSKISAKKGIDVKDVGTRAARPSELTAGVDFKYEREMKACTEELADLERRKTEANNSVAALTTQMDQLEAELGQVAQAQDGCMVQKRQLEEKLKVPSVTDNPEKRSLLDELIADLAAKFEALDQRVSALMAQDDQLRSHSTVLKADLIAVDEKILEINRKIAVLEEAAKLDPGVPVVKVNGIVYTGTTVAGPHRKIILPQEMQNVRIAEQQEEGKQCQMKISCLK